jgi:hypothetical protein
LQKADALTSDRIADNFILIRHRCYYQGKVALAGAQKKQRRHGMPFLCRQLQQISRLTSK